MRSLLNRLIISSAATNDTLSFGQDMGADMKKFFPSLTDESLSALEQASSLIVFNPLVPQS